MNTIQSKWEQFNDLAIHAEAPQIQREEMQKAFFSGAFSLMVMVRNTSSMSEDAAIALMESWFQEGADFIRGCAYAEE